MDNPWANAWEEPESNKTSTLVSSVPATNWKKPAENETDIALPSWSSGPAVTWNEPSDDAPSLWESANATEPALISSSSAKSLSWTSSYESMSAHFEDSTTVQGTETYEELAEESVEEEELGEVEHDEENEEDAEQAPDEIVDPWTPSQSTFPATSIDSVLVDRPPLSPPPAPGTPDAFEFGTFESNSSTVESSAGEDTWTSAVITTNSAWGETWAKETEINQEPEEERLDEWERAKREKERMDRVVPPEFLASILQTLDEISDDLWAPAKPTKKDGDLPSLTEPPREDDPKVDATQKASHDEGTDLSEEVTVVEGQEQEITDVEDVAKDVTVVDVSKASEGQPKSDHQDASDGWKELEVEDSFNRWKGGIDAVEGLTLLCETITPPLPPLSALPALSFKPNSSSQTSLSKRSSEAIRLTRSTMIATSGPLGMYLRTKGSIEWEVAVKARPEKTSEEEREETVPVGWRILPKEDEKKKVDAPEMKRKGTGILSSFFGRSAQTPPAEPQEAKEATPRPSSNFTSPRASTDSSGSKPETKIESSSVRITTNPVSAPVPSTSPTNPTSPLSTYGDGGSVDLFQDSPPIPPNAPSAVSRFLNRFSRARPSHSRQNSNTSLALSTDDLEFLGDIVPSATDDHSDMAGLQDMIGSAPLPAPLLPPPRITTQSSSTRSSTDDGNTGASWPSTLFSSSGSISTPLPAHSSQIPATENTSPYNHRSPTPSSFISPPVSRSSSPGLDMLAVSGSSAAASRASVMGTATGLLKPSSTLLNPRSGASTMKKPVPVAIMSSSGSSSKSSLNSFSFLPPPPSIRPQSSPSSLLIDDEPPSAAMPAPAPSTLSDFDEDEFSDFHSGTPSQAPFSAAPLFSSSSAHSLFSAGSSAFNGPDSANIPNSSSVLSAEYKERDYSDPLNTSVSSVASANSTDTILLSGDINHFRDFSDPFSDLASPAPRETLRTPSPPAPPAKSPGKVATRNVFASSSVGSADPTRIIRKVSTNKKTTGGSGVGGRVAPGRLNLPPPVAASAYSRNWGTGQGSIPSADSVDAPLGLSASEPNLATMSSSPPSSPKAHQRRVSKEAHQRTRSLVEDAAANGRKWPSPASDAVATGRYGGPGYGAYGFGTAPPLSPLPPILSPPPESSSDQQQKDKDFFGLGTFGDDDDDDVPLATLAAAPNPNVSLTSGSTFALQQARSRAGTPSSFQLGSLDSTFPGTNGTPSRNGTLPPVPLSNPLSNPRPTHQSASLMGFAGFGSTSTTPSSSTSATTNSASSTATRAAGGLSAQDLSFFEGL
ncbi:hypothetical protein BDP27DRAFT_1397264 [Rhodocollybia butyracea]|uniref:Uncharacterized protein n=1 Tax=Rhodocollybia butyracea TaxID=206335 RepID=A0A9P5UGZ2_9AGAR|nr:hypothetical protein BDP27DRAFT_1397264 [Rhodocollybia butyracea]